MERWKGAAKDSRNLFMKICRPLIQRMKHEDELRYEIDTYGVTYAIDDREMTDVEQQIM